MDFDRNFNVFRRHVDSLFDDFDRTFYRYDPYLLAMPDERIMPTTASTQGENNGTTMTTTNGGGTNTAMSKWNRNIAPRMKVDVIEEPNAYVVQAELPGVTKDDVKLTVDNDILTISAERKNEVNEEDKNKRFVRMERSYGAVSRSLRLPPGCDASKVTAKHENGVLKVSVARNPQHAASKHIPIQ